MTFAAEQARTSGAWAGRPPARGTCPRLAISADVVASHVYRAQGRAAFLQTKIGGARGARFNYAVRVLDHVLV